MYLVIIFNLYVICSNYLLQKLLTKNIIIVLITSNKLYMLLLNYNIYIPSTAAETATSMRPMMIWFMKLSLISEGKITYIVIVIRIVTIIVQQTELWRSLFSRSN